MKKLKKFVCFVLAAVMVLSIHVPVFAMEAQGSETGAGETGVGHGAPLAIEVTTNKAKYTTPGIAKINVTVTNTSSEDIRNVSTEAVFKQLAPAGRNSETKKEVDTLKSGESISFSYKATINKEEYKLNIFDKIFLWLVRLFNGGFSASENGFDDGRNEIEQTDVIAFGKFSAENVVKVWYGEAGGEKPDTPDKNYEELISDVDIDGIYKYDKKDISIDEDTNIKYINNIIIAMFEDDCSDERKAEIINAVDGKVVGGDIIYNELYIEIKKSTLEELKMICDKLNNETGLYLSGYEKFNTGIHLVPNDPFKNGEKISLVDWNVGIEDIYQSYNNWWALATSLREAWDYNGYFSNINIGVADNGFDTSHEDLNIQVVSKEKSSGNHGTHVAGLIGATHNNNKGIAGAASNCSLYGYDVADDDGMTDREIYKSLKTLVKEYNCKIINFSLGTEPYVNNGKVYEDENFKYGLSDDDVNSWGKEASKKIGKLLENGYDFIVVQSAGNGDKKDHIGMDADNNGHFSSIKKENCYSSKKVSADDIMNRVIIVANANKPTTGSNYYELARSSNGGTDFVDIAAPGTWIYSTLAGIEEWEDGVRIVDEGQQYGWSSGTSMAAPIVTGIAGLVWSVNSNFTGEQVKKIIMDTAKQGGIVAKDNPASPTRGDFYVVNAKLAVEEAIKKTYRTYTLSGSVADFENKEPLVDVRIKATNIEGNKTITGKSDENGNFSLLLPVGKYNVTFAKSGYIYNLYTYQVTISDNNVIIIEPILLLKEKEVFIKAKNLGKTYTLPYLFDIDNYSHYCMVCLNWGSVAQFLLLLSDDDIYVYTSENLRRVATKSDNFKVYSIVYDKSTDKCYDWKAYQQDTTNCLYSSEKTKDNLHSVNKYELFKQICFSSHNLMENNAIFYSQNTIIQT